jgi:hypothetical protein
MVLCFIKKLDDGDRVQKQEDCDSQKISRILLEPEGSLLRSCFCNEFFLRWFNKRLTVEIIFVCEYSTWNATKMVVGW